LRRNKWEARPIPPQRFRNRFTLSLEQKETTE
jgi:hypothetical protein